MAKATLVKDGEWERDYQIPSGQIITLKLEKDWSQITFWENGTMLGKNEEFVFKDRGAKDSSHLLARMYIPLKHSGLGRAAVEFFKSITGVLIYCRPNDGTQRDDGSHLTGDAPGFVERMIAEGLIAGYDTNELFHDEDDM